MSEGWAQRLRAPGPLSVGLAVIAWLCLLLVVYLTDTPTLSGADQALLCHCQRTLSLPGCPGCRSSEASSTTSLISADSAHTAGTAATTAVSLPRPLT